MSGIAIVAVILSLLLVLLVYLKLISNTALMTLPLSPSKAVVASGHYARLTLARNQYATWQLVVGTTDKRTHFKTATVIEQAVRYLGQLKIWHWLILNREFRGATSGVYGLQLKGCRIDCQNMEREVF